MKVIFTERAYVSVLAETAEKIQTETGGIFLGYREGDVWYVMESIDPGPKSTFEIAYFEYDQKYVNHLAQKVARLYKKPLELLGLWHRHPGSFDQFSGTDDGTNKKFASQHKDGAISALINIDPNFRITMFHIVLPLSYIRVKYEVGDGLLPEHIKGYCNTQRLIDYLSAKESSIWGTSRPVMPKYKYDEILEAILSCCSSIDVTSYVNEENIPLLNEENISLIIEETEEDVDFLGNCYLECQMSMKNKHISIILKDNIRVVFDFCITPQDNRVMLKYKDRYYLYAPNIFKTIITDIVEAKKKRKIFFVLNKEFVECSIQKLKRN